MRRSPRGDERKRIAAGRRRVASRSVRPLISRRGAADEVADQLGPLPRGVAQHPADRLANEELFFAEHRHGQLGEQREVAAARAQRIELRETARCAAPRSRRRAPSRAAARAALPAARAARSCVASQSTCAQHAERRTSPISQPASPAPDELALALEHADRRRVQIEPVGRVERVDDGDERIVIERVRFAEFGARGANRLRVDAVKASARSSCTRARTRPAPPCLGGEALLERIGRRLHAAIIGYARSGCGSNSVSARRSLSLRRSSICRTRSRDRFRWRPISASVSCSSHNRRRARM